MTGTDLVIVNPDTGEALTLDAPTQDLADWLYTIRAQEALVRDMKTQVTAELLARMDRDATWTVRLPGRLKLVGQSPAPVEEWNAEELSRALCDLVEQGLISVQAVEQAVQTVVSVKVRKAGITALRKLGGKVAETIDAHAVQADPVRRVSVTHE